jgi:hypothetical protein
MSECLPNSEQGRIWPAAVQFEELNSATCLVGLRLTTGTLGEDSRFPGRWQLKINFRLRSHSNRGK